MRIVLNGEARDAPAGITVADLLTWLDVDARLVAVELNRTVVKRARYADTPVTENAEVEIVAFVGGGSRSRKALDLTW
jgi:sulfur carrier protein